MNINIFWFRRDLRIKDNHAWSLALTEKKELLPIFIFDEHILSELDADDARVNFIYDSLEKIDQDLKVAGHCGLKIFRGKPEEIFKKLAQKWDIDTLFFNEDYEPYALERDKVVEKILQSKGSKIKSVTDHLIFHPDTILKNDGTPYTVYTPYKNKWLAHFEGNPVAPIEDLAIPISKIETQIFPTKETLGIEPSLIKIPLYNFKFVRQYEEVRDLPGKDLTTYIGTHLRFGTVGIRSLVNYSKDKSAVYLSELIWREFFTQILYHFPKVVNQSFKTKYERIPWRNNKKEFEAWCNGETGIDLVDAGMKQLNATGFMHNRARMVCASFLTKNLLIDWRWGEAYFAKKLLDFELSSNNGNWQWAAGTGCDASPYFRVFNPDSQLVKFDKDRTYTKKWLGNSERPEPIVDLKTSRKRAIDTYKAALALEN